MPRIAYGVGAYRRSNGDLPELKLVNMFIEAVPAEEAGAVLLSRKGLSQVDSVGDGPVTGIYSEPGVFGGDVFRVSDGVLYREASALGAIVGDGPVSFAGRSGEVLVTAGARLYSYNGLNLQAVTVPDAMFVRAVAYHDGLFIAIRNDSQRYHWSAVNDGRSWDALDFASAERFPDNILDLSILNDTLWLFGEQSIEPFANTGEADSPYQRFEQRFFSVGIRATGCRAAADNSEYFIGHDSVVYRITDEGPGRVSDHSVEERIAASDDASMFAYTFEGHSFVCIRLDDGTFAYDVATRQWSELQSHGRALRGRCACMIGDQPRFGDDETGKTWEFSGWDDDGGPLERLFTAGFPIKGGILPIDRLMVEANVGRTDLLAGQGSNPLIEMRYSRDAGATFSDWEAAPLGQQGEYRTIPEWRALGSADWPGFIAELRMTEPCGLRVSGVYINEPGGGRSR